MEAKDSTSNVAHFKSSLVAPTTPPLFHFECGMYIVTVYMYTYTSNLVSFGGEGRLWEEGSLNH